MRKKYVHNIKNFAENQLFKSIYETVLEDNKTQNFLVVSCVFF